MIVIVWILAAGIVYLSSFDKLSEQTPYDTTMINSLNNIEYDQFRDNDTHYERVDREKKYYASMSDIQLTDNEGDSIQITFDANYFQFDRNGDYIKPQLQHNLEFVTTISEGQTFVAGCNSFSIRDEPSTERIPVKQIHILRYEGITEKDGVDYYGFAHEAGFIPDDVECKFPEMIQYSLDIDFDISETNFYGDVWDNDWN